MAHCEKFNECKNATSTRLCPVTGAKGCFKRKAEATAPQLVSPSKSQATGYANLLDEAIAAMGKLHGRMAQCEIDGSAAICAEAVREFVDAHARLLYERHQLAGDAPKESVVA